MNTTLRVAPKEYLFNEDAAAFRAVTLDVTYTGRSRSFEAGALLDRIDDFLETETYTAVIELDEDDRVIGGEWTGASKRHHPDFLWDVAKVEEHPIAGGLIEREDVLQLHHFSRPGVDDDPDAPFRVVEPH